MALNPSQTLEENAAATGVSCATIIDAVWRPFQVLTTTLLSLLLPLSYLLLARLATAGYLLSVSESHPTTSFVTSYFLHTKSPTILHLIASIIAVAALSNALTGKTASLLQPPMQRRVYAVWLFLVSLQVFVGVGIEGSTAACIEGSSFGQESNLACRLVFFLGLHETMLFWWRRMVKPVVDDTFFGWWREEGRAEKVAVGLIYGGLWWWRLRAEVEALVAVPEVKREMMMGIGMVDFFGWWLYYVTATVGLVRIVKGLFLTVLILTHRRGVRENQPNDEKIYVEPV